MTDKRDERYPGGSKFGEKQTPRQFNNIDDLDSTRNNTMKGN